MKVLDDPKRRSIRQKLAPVIGDDDAENLVSALPSEDDDIVTKQFLRAELSENFSIFRTEMDDKFTTLRSDMDRKLALLGCLARGAENHADHRPGTSRCPRCCHSIGELALSGRHVAERQPDPPKVDWVFGRSLRSIE